MEADMKLIRVGQICLLVALAVGAIAATSASAVEYGVKGLPEVGRCVKTAVGVGIYGGPACLTVAKPGRGKYEWTPVSATEKQTFLGSGGETILTAEGHPTIKCIAANFSGEYTGPKGVTVQIELQACVNSLGQQCQTTAPNKSEIKAVVEGEIGFIKNQKIETKTIVVVGLDLRPQAPLPTLTTYECGSVTETTKLEGSVIGKIGPINKMTTESNLVYNTRTSGAQIYEKFEEGLKDTLISTFQTGTESTSVASTLKIKEYKGKNAAPLEIKAK
jgi:hypothetical protein